ncbi:MAG: metallopeptidase [Oscillospiraceae bacterium]|nr:metallopeptidase [Oscillospiraceae bacterium]MBQ3500115.1 metallopeptidase [Oscillospiraceae bacterium]
MNEERTGKLNNLALEVLRLSRNTLLVNLRFLDSALSRFEYIPTDESTLLTDGEHLLYNPEHVLKRYKHEKERPVRDYLHIVFHCIYRHMFMDPSLDRPLWDLACDIAVENIILELGLRSTSSEIESLQQSYINELKSKIKLLTAEKIYRCFKDENLDPMNAADIRARFYADNHEIWYMTSEEAEAAYGVSFRGAQGESSDGEGDSAEGEGGFAMSKAELAQMWKDISERMGMDLETFSKMQGRHAGSLTQNLLAVNREKYDYTAFLKKFAVMGEQMRINDDEFDYIFYTYGLDLYENMPLIEPLEYKEVKAIKEFVIAIDTSGSTSGELVQKFVQKTYNILKSTESFFSKVNIHIIQCDADIQEDKKITSQEDFDEYLKTMQIRGLGGTDFRPVFEYVETLRKNKEFTNLKGLIYFTDGYGDFPARKPDYDTAFVFVDDEYNNPDVPPWAIKLVLQKDEI